MPKICWVVPKLKKSKFTGGIYSVLKHAQGLAERGHEVCVVPLLPSTNPDWFGSYDFRLKSKSRWEVASELARGINSDRKLESVLHALSSAFASVEPRVLPFSFRCAAMSERARVLLPKADITVATSFETALPVHLYGSGVRAYYAQHFEPFFCNEFDEAAHAEAAARASYSLPLKIIANSLWLAEIIDTECGRKVEAIAGNAIEDSMFAGAPPELTDPPLRVISYGGRAARWKGFDDMAEGVRLARQQGVSIDWSVYGDCSMSPQNTIAPFRSLGFLNSNQLASAYSKAEVLLSASWYESFPLFPLEAMAAGLAVITTRPGTEEFARHGETALIVPPRDPVALCNAMISLANNAALRRKLGVQGMEQAKNHTWELAAARMDEVLSKLLR